MIKISQRGEVSEREQGDVLRFSTFWGDLCSLLEKYQISKVFIETDLYNSFKGLLCRDQMGWHMSSGSVMTECYLLYEWSSSFFYRLHVSSLELEEGVLREVKSRLNVLFAVDYFSFSRPILLPLFEGSGDSIIEINKKLISNLSLVFLNGQTKTGRSTFVKLQLLLLTGTFVRFHEGLFVVGKYKFLWCSELADLDDTAQTHLLADIRSEVYDCCYIASAYPLGALVDGGIISLALSDVLSSVRLVFPSLKTVGQNVVLSVLNHWKVCRFQYKDTKLTENLDLDLSFLDLLLAQREVQKKSAEVVPTSLDLRATVTALEIAMIEKAHQEYGGSQNAIAERLGISRGSLQHKIKKYNLPYGEGG